MSGRLRVDHLVRSERNALVNRSLNRLTQQRGDESWLAARLSDPKTRLIPVWRQRNLISTRHQTAAWLSPEDCAGLVPYDNRAIFLGQRDGLHYFTFEIENDTDPLTDGSIAAAGSFEDLRKFGPILPDEDLSLLAYAKGICYWHSRHRFCGVCSSPTVLHKAGHLRKCRNPACQTVEFPRTDPAIIVLVCTDDDCCLLGRQPRWPKGRFSTIAGFVEPGESVEQAVVREVWEETGINATRMTYQSSQPWPFPGSLMLGFHADAKRQPVRLNDAELEEAGWFTRGQIVDALNGHGPVSLPPAISISHRLIADWCRER